MNFPLLCSGWSVISQAWVENFDLCFPYLPEMKFQARASGRRLVTERPGWAHLHLGLAVEPGFRSWEVGGCPASKDCLPTWLLPSEPSKEQDELSQSFSYLCGTWLTMLQIDLASSENFSEYSSVSFLTLLSTSSRLTFSLYFLNGECPSIISYNRQPSPHQSGPNVYFSLLIISGAT